jgi:hypothetical protein
MTIPNPDGPPRGPPAQRPTLRHWHIILIVVCVLLAVGALGYGCLTCIVLFDF